MVHQVLEWFRHFQQEMQHGVANLKSARSVVDSFASCVVCVFETLTVSSLSFPTCQGFPVRLVMSHEPSGQPYDLL